MIHPSISLALLFAVYLNVTDYFQLCQLMALQHLKIDPQNISDITEGGTSYHCQCNSLQRKITDLAYQQVYISCYAPVLNLKLKTIIYKLNCNVLHLNLVSTLYCQ